MMKRKDGKRNPIQRLFSSDAVWRLTGFTYRTAIIATNGKYLSKISYLNEGKTQMKKFFAYLHKDMSVMEFGCGPGKNLFGISDLIKTGYGIDVNSRYIRIAKKLASKYNFKNLSFVKYDGDNLPNIPKVDLIIEKGVFERLDKNTVRLYIEKLKKYMNKNGIIILYFLMEKAKGTEFTKRLGDLSYIFWDHNEIQRMLDDTGFRIKEIIREKHADYYLCELDI